MIQYNAKGIRGKPNGNIAASIARILSTENFSYSSVKALPILAIDFNLRQEIVS